MAQFEVRPCRQEDLPAVVDLLVANGRPAPGVDVAQIRDYAQSVYFENPWVRDDMPSLLCVDAQGVPKGFVGVIPRRMAFKGDTIHVAVPGNFVVRAGDEGKANAFMAMAMIKRLFAGPQDITLTDTANDLSRRLWESSGAVVVGLQSLDWFRPIKPATAILQMMETVRRTRLPMSGPLHLAARTVDVAGTPALARMARRKEANFTLEPLDCDELLKGLGRARAGYDICGGYDAAGLEWIRRMLADKASNGRTLRQAIVRDERGDHAGAFIYILSRTGAAETMLLAGRDDKFPVLLHALIADAASHNGSFVAGTVQPRQLATYKGQRCFLLFNNWTIVHSRRPELTDAFLRGRALLTRLDGERWTRFGDLYDV